MKIMITGGTGFIGTALTRSLLANGHSVWILTRSPERANHPAGAQPVRWDGHSSQGWLDIFSQMDGVVNLAGATVGQWPWNEARKKVIHDSRVQAGQAVAQAYQQASGKPSVLIQASGVGYYGPCGNDAVNENSPAGADFMAAVASDWEASTSSVDDLAGVRRAIIRTSLVLDARQGVLPLMALPVRLFAGGPLGNGRQGVSWIHIDDEVRAIRFLLDNESAHGVFNLSAPNPLPSAEFIRALAKTLKRPYWVPAPAFALKMILGEMSTLLLDGQFAMPQRLMDLGFVFRYEQASVAFNSLF